MIQHDQTCSFFIGGRRCDCGAAPSSEQAQQGAELKPCRHGHIHCLACMNNRPAAAAPAVGVENLPPLPASAIENPASDFLGRPAVYTAEDMKDYARAALAGAAQPAVGVTEAIVEPAVVEYLRGKVEHAKATGDHRVDLNLYTRRVESILAALSGAAPTKPTTAGAYLRKKAEAYAMEHGHDEMGGLSFGSGAHAEVKMDHYTNLLELADELDALAGAAQGAEPVAVDISKLQRYRMSKQWHTMNRDPEGPYVQWDDVAALVAPQPPTGTSQENQQ